MWAIITSIFGKIFSDWRLLLAFGIIIAGSLVMWKFKSLENDLKKAQQTLVIEKKNNETLRGNVAILESANKNNAVVIDQVAKDRDNAIASMTRLNGSISANNKSIADLKQKIEGLKNPPTPLTEYLVEAVDGVQKLRDSQAAGQPKEAGK